MKNGIVCEGVVIVIDSKLHRPICLRSNWLILFVHLVTDTFSHCAIEKNINCIGLSVIGLGDLLLHVAGSATVFVE